MKTALIFIVAIVYEIIPPVLSEDVSSSEGKVIHEEILNEMPYLTPKPTGNAFLSESFDDLEDFNKRWMISKAKKDDSSSEDISKYSGVWSVEPAESDNIKKDLGLVLKSKAKHHAISVKLDKPYVFDGKPFVLQYEVRFQNGQECGGAYIKLLTDDKDFSLENFHDKVPYTVMFGPDKCGNDAKLHFIFRHKNPKNNSIEEKHWKKTPNVPKFEEIFSDKKPHLFTLIVKPDDQFEVKLDNQVIQKGNLLEEFEPPVNPPAEIDDPEDFKPEDWDDKPKIPDPDDFKPDDWDEDAPKEILDMKAEKPSGWLDDEDDTIDDPDAVKPDDWDDDMDGEWEPPKISNPKCQSSPGCGEWKRPMIPNPEYKGKWKPSMIENPNYKGVWKPRRIPNPDFFEDKKPYYMMPIGAVGFELWSMSDGILFDNIIITDDVAVARKFAEDSFDVKKEKADAESTIWSKYEQKTNKHPYVFLVYVMYCVAPIVAFLYYLKKRVAEDSAFTRFIRYSNNRPWLWAVYLLLIAVPLVLFITFCCPSSSNKEENSIGEKKKNDTFEVDDVIQEENEDNQPEDQKDQDVNGEEINDENEVLDEVEEESEPARRTSPRRRKPRIE